MAIIKKFRIKSFKKNKPILKLEKISLSFKKRHILENISFVLNQGEILGLLGPNGVGKSTIFNLITGILKPDYGGIIINNKNDINYPIAERAKVFNIGYVPQYGGYFHDLTLIENLKAIAEIQIQNPKNRNHEINKIVSKFEFDSVLNIPAKFLSGGQKKISYSASFTKQSKSSSSRWTFCCPRCSNYKNVERAYCKFTV